MDVRVIFIIVNYLCDIQDGYKFVVVCSFVLRCSCYRFAYEGHGMFSLYINLKIIIIALPYPFIYFNTFIHSFFKLISSYNENVHRWTCPLKGFFPLFRVVVV